MDFYNFPDQQSVEREAQKLIGRILSDKSYTNPQKLSLLISQYQKKQIRLDSQLSKVVKSQIECIIQSKQSVSQANKWMQQANQKTEKIKQIWQQNIEFHEFMEDVISMGILESNLAKIIQQLTYFIDMQTQMIKLQKLSQDQNKHILVNNKLLNLISLRDALLEDASWQRQTAIMRKQFIKVDNFQISFYDRIFQKFSDCLKWGKDNPDGLRISVKVIMAYDKALELKGKPKIMKDRAMQMIKQSIDQRFNQKLQDQDQLISIIQHAKFATTDLVEVGDYVSPCFPKEFPIMQIYQSQYQANIEKHIIPFFDQIQQQQQYGNLVALLGWIDDYQTMLSRAGHDSTNLVALKSKVKILMPFFIDHNRKLIQDYIDNCLHEDQKNYNRKFYEEVIRDGGDLVSFFPSDIFRFINQQAELIKGQLKGQIFVEFVRCITQSISLFQQHLAKQLINDFETIKMLVSQQKIVDFQYKVILFINNFNQCLKHAGESKELFSQIVSQDYKPRIEKIFMVEVQKQFNYSIPKFIRIVVQIIYLNIIRQSFPLLFTPKWLTDNSRQILTNILKTIVSQINDIESQNLIINIIHYRMLVKQCLQFLLLGYIEQLILNVRTIYKMSGSNWKPQYTDQLYTQKQFTDNNVDFKSVFNSKVAISQAIKKDKHIFLKFAESFSENTSKIFMTKLTNKFVLLGQLFIKKKADFQVLMNKIVQSFPQQASYLIDVIMIVRDDIEGKSFHN